MTAGDDTAALLALARATLKAEALPHLPPGRRYPVLMVLTALGIAARRLAADAVWRAAALADLEPFAAGAPDLASPSARSPAACARIPPSCPPACTRPCPASLAPPPPRATPKPARCRACPMPDAACAGPFPAATAPAILPPMDPAALCRDCLSLSAVPGRCPACGSPRRLRHPELVTLSIAHLDCDAFYASVEKRDDPSLRDKPVIVGGGKRGVVTTACYIARIKGVRSAMPMFEALKLCPEAVVVRPRMARYVEVSREIRARMEALTPLVEPLSLDEAFLDLTGTERLHRAPPALLMARLQAGIERDLALTVSIGLSHNKFLAKIASDLDKPRGFAIVGRAETDAFLAARPIGVIWGVGPATLKALQADGLHSIADLRARGRTALIARFGASGDRLWRLAQGLDARAVSSGRGAKSVSNETTFGEDLAALDDLKPILWDLAETVSGRLKAGGLGGRTVTLKLKRADHRLLTRRQSLAAATGMADTLYRTALSLLQREMSMAPFRLLGLGVSDISASPRGCDADLLDGQKPRRLAAETAADRIRNRFGASAIVLGRSLR